MQIVRVEERLRGEGFFEDGIGEGKDHDRGPAAPGATRNLADQESAATIHGSHDDQRAQQCDGQITEQILRHQRSNEKQTDCRRYASHEAPQGYLCSHARDRDRHMLNEAG
jgi:hypothetical protein